MIYFYTLQRALTVVLTVVLTECWLSVDCNNAQHSLGSHQVSTKPAWASLSSLIRAYATLSSLVRACRALWTEGTLLGAIAFIQGRSWKQRFLDQGAKLFSVRDDTNQSLLLSCLPLVWEVLLIFRWHNTALRFVSRKDLLVELKSTPPYTYTTSALLYIYIGNN